MPDPRTRSSTSQIFESSTLCCVCRVRKLIRRPALPDLPNFFESSTLCCVCRVRKLSRRPALPDLPNFRVKHVVLRMSGPEINPQPRSPGPPPNFSSQARCAEFVGVRKLSRRSQANQGRGKGRRPAGQREPQAEALTGKIGAGCWHDL